MSTHAFDPGAAAPADSGIYGLPHSPEQAKVVLLPVPFEATTSYGGGTSDGPRALLSASRQVDLFDGETGRPYEHGIALLPEPEQVRRWNDDARKLSEPIIEAGGNIAGDAKATAALAQVNALCDRMNG